MKITLTKEEGQLCAAIGRKNWDYSINKKAKRSKFDGKPAGMDDCIGLKGELAVGKYLKVESYMEPFSDDKEFREHDLEYKNNLIDVKSTARKYGNLVVPLTQKSHNVSIYVLCTVDGLSVDILGWVEKGTLMKGRDNIRNLGYGDCYYYSRGKLHPPEELQSLS